MDWSGAYVLLIALGAISGAVLATFALVRPLLRWLARQNAIYDMLAGSPGIPGIKPAQASLFDRMTANEKTLAEAVSMASSAVETSTKAMDLATRAFALVQSQSGPAVVQVLPESSRPQP